MRLSTLIPEPLSCQISGDTDIPITGLTEDSREVKPGFIFAAISGMQTDGTQFITDAIKNGAVAVIAPPDADVSPEITAIRHPEPRAVLGHMAARWYGAVPRMIAAVTGTNGKTSVAHFARQLWHILGKSAASIGTLGIFRDAHTRLYDTAQPMTTPDTLFLHETLKNLAGQGVEYLALEASSHGLAQHRLAGVAINIGAFTNFSRDHLDYHDSEEAYFAAKMCLFDTVIVDQGAAVLNADIPEYPEIEKHCATRDLRVLRYGADAPEIQLHEITPEQASQRMRVTVEGKEYTLTLPLIGDFQAQNVLCACGIVIASGQESARVIAACEQLTAVPGRLQHIGETPSGAHIYVDYAHTPDALAHVLQAVRPHISGTLSVVFGCGGDRDPGKRPLMGKIACEAADQVIITDDNPRSEDPAQIRQEILAACDKNAQEIGDRETAIATAIKALNPGDTLIIAGKGHEDYQIIGDTTLHFDDAKIAKKYLSQA